MLQILLCNRKEGKINKILNTKSVLEASVAIIPFAVFLSVLKNGFVTCDEPEYISE